LQSSIDHVDKVGARDYVSTMNVIRRTLDSDEPGISEDRRRLDAFRQTRAAVPLDQVKAWVASWGSRDELPRPAPRRLPGRHCEER
jgi:hypothetical protein